MFSGFSAKSTVCCAFCMLSHPGWQFLKSQKVESVHWDAAFLIQVMSGDWKSHLDEWRNICPAGNTAPGWPVSFLGYCTVTHSNKITRKLLAGLPHFTSLCSCSDSTARKLVLHPVWSDGKICFRSFPQMTPILWPSATAHLALPVAGRGPASPKNTWSCCAPPSRLTHTLESPSERTCPRPQACPSPASR